MAVRHTVLIRRWTKMKRLKDGRIDGRSLHRTGRTENMTLRVSGGFSDDVKKMAMASGMRMGQLVETAVRAWASQGNPNLGRHQDLPGATPDPKFKIPRR
jgi:hypothetical protein